MISQSLVDYTNMGRNIGCILDNVYAPYASMKDRIGLISSYFRTSMVIHPGSNYHIQIRNLIHGNMLSSSWKKQRNGKVSLNNDILGVDYRMTINMLMNYSYIIIWYFYIWWVDFGFDQYISLL